LELRCPAIFNKLQLLELKKDDRETWVTAKQFAKMVLEDNTWSDSFRGVGKEALKNALSYDLANPEARAAFRLVFEHMACT